MEEKTGGGIGGRRNPHPDYSQAYRPAGPFRGRNGLSNSLFVIASGNCRQTRRTWPSACEGELSHHAKTEALPDALSDSRPETVKIREARWQLYIAHSHPLLKTKTPPPPRPTPPSSTPPT